MKDFDMFTYMCLAIDTILIATFIIVIFHFKGI